MPNTKYNAFVQSQGKFTKMPRSGWQQAKQDEIEAKRQLILRAATDHVNQNGYTGASMARIAGELGLTPNALYYYFKNKDEMLFSCFERAITLLDGCIDQAIEAGTTPVEKLQRFVEGFIALVDHEPLPFIGHAIFLPERLLRKIDAKGEAQLARIAAIIEEGASEGSKPALDPILGARLLLSGLFSIDIMTLKQSLPGSALAQEMSSLVARVFARREGVRS